MVKRSTVNDVARLAQVSASTVSRHLRGVAVGGPATARIESAIAELQYQPNETARALRGGSSRTIGVIIPQVNNSFYAQATQLIEEEARKQGFTVILLTHQELPERQAAHVMTIRRYHADGLVLAPAAGSTFDSIRDALHGLPVVAIDRSISPEMDSVTLRNRESARSATEHLIHHGYQRIACVVSRPEIPSFELRLEGYREAIASRGFSEMIIHAPDHEQLRFTLCSALLQKHRPDALLSFSNRATQTILQAFDELALPREQHLPLLGFDDFELAALVEPPVSVMRQPIEQMVRHALSILFERIRGNASLEVQNITLPAQMVLRRSCGCL